MADRVQFLVFGDMPYSQAEQSMLTGPDGSLFQAVHKEPHDFLVHVGDLKAGAWACRDSLLQGNYKLLDELSPVPLVYTPGDNDWTDCDRPFLFPSFDELERLDYVRQHFASHNIELAGYKRQPDFPENQSWQQDGVGFVTLHVTGTNNGRRQILQSDKPQALALVEQRDKANVQWLKAALTPDLKAAVVFMQADLYQSQSAYAACNSQNQQECDGFKLYRETLSQLAEQLPYPLMLVHGDTGEYCFSQRQSGLWRLNAPGDFRVLDIASVTVTPELDIKFQIKGLLSGQPAPNCE